MKIVKCAVNHTKNPKIFIIITGNKLILSFVLCKITCKRQIVWYNNVIAFLHYITKRIIQAEGETV